MADNPTSLGISRDSIFNNVTARRSLAAPSTRLASAFPVLQAGSLLYETSTGTLYVSTGTEWVSIGGGPSPSTFLPPPLQSIAGLSTSGNEILYTLGIDTYSTSPISSAGRSFISVGSQASQRAAIGLVPGVDVQAQSSALNSLISIAPTPDRIAYTNGGGLFSSTTLATWARQNLLTTTSANDVATLIGSITGTSTNADRLVRTTGVNSVIESGVGLDSLGNISNINSLDAISISNSSGDLTVEGALVPSGNWTNVASLNQNVGVGATNINFGNFGSPFSMSGNKITSLGAPTASNDAATKNYVDNATAGAGSTFGPTRAASTANINLGAGGLLTIDGVGPLTAGDRVLAKNQTDPKENGIYDAAAGAWLRSSDADTGLEFENGKTVVVLEGTTQTGTQWITSSATSPPTLGVDDIVFTQINTFVSGTGIDIAGNTISIDSPLEFAQGGTGNTTFPNTNRIIATNSVGPSSLTQTTLEFSTGNPNSVVTEQGTQSLTNKTIINPSNIIRASRLGTTGSDVIINTSAPSAAGEVLLSTGIAAATWQTMPLGFTPGNTVFVFIGALNVSPAWSTLTQALADPIVAGANINNPVLIDVYPGVYDEPGMPLTIPEYVSVSGASQTHGGVTFRPTTSGSTMIIMSGNSRVSAITLDGDVNGDGAISGYATIGINCASGPITSIDLCERVTVQNCSSSCFRVDGGGFRFGRILICRITAAIVVSPGFTVTNGYEVTNGGIVSGFDLTTSAFLGTGSVMINGFNINGDYSLVNATNVNPSAVVNGIVVGGGTTSTSRDDYPTYRCNGTTLSLISGIGLFAKDKSVVRVSDFSVLDVSDIFPNALDFFLNAPALPADSNLIVAMWTNIRFERIGFGGAANNPSIVQGLNLSETPGEVVSQFSGEVSVGLPFKGTEMAVGEGDSYILGMKVFSDDGGVFTDITIPLQFNPPATLFADLMTSAADGAVNLASAPATFDGVAPNVNDVILIQFGSTANPGSSSVDNGLYVWTGAGNVMTRTASFPVGRNFSDKTYVNVNGGVTLYRSEWKLGQDITVGTTSFFLQSYSASALPLIPTNGDAVYFGSLLGLKFPGLEMDLTSEITTLSSIPSSSVIQWEYSTGVGGWAALPLMTVNANSPYTNRGNLTFAYGEAILPTQDVSYHIRFGNISSTWNIDFVNGFPGYWVRARVTDAANIVKVPILSRIKLGTNNTSINKDGYLEQFGTGRTYRTENIPSSSLTNTGISGETAPASQRLVATNTAPDISSLRPNCTFADSIHTSTCFVWDPPLIDSSLPIRLVLTWSRSTTGPNNVALQIDYIITNDGDAIGNTSGAASVTPKTTGIVATPVSSSTRRQFTTTFDLGVVGLLPPGNILWVKISRYGSDGADTYNNDIYLINVNVKYPCYNIGDHILS